MKTPDGYLTISEAARKYKIQRGTLYARCYKGKIKGALQVGRSWFVPDINFDQIDEESGLLTRTTDPGYVTVGEAARYIGITNRQILRYRDENRIPGIKQISGKHWVVPLSWVEDHKKELVKMFSKYITISQAAKILEVPRAIVAYWAYSKKIEGIFTKCKPGASHQSWYIPWLWVEAEATIRGKEISRATREEMGIAAKKRRKRKHPDGYITITEAAQKYGIPLDMLNAKLNAGEISEVLFVSRFCYIPIQWLEENKNKLSPIPRGYVTLSETARRLGLSRDQVDWLKKTNKIPGIKQVSDYFWVVPTHWVRSYKKRLQSKPEGCITINQAAEMLGISRARIVELRDQGRIEGAVCINSTRKYWFIPLTWVEAEIIRRGNKVGRP